MSSIVLGLVGGILAWVATELMAGPWRRFLRLRYEVVTKLELYDRWNPWGDQGASSEWLAERERTYRLSAAELIAFNGAEWILPRLLAPFKIDLAEAGFAMLELSYLPHAGSERSRAKHDVLRGLRVKDTRMPE